MSVTADKQIKSGFLHVPPTSWLQTLLNKPWVRKQCVLYPDSRQGVRRLEVFDLLPSLRRKEPAGLIIPLNDCLKVAEERHKEHPFVFSVRTRDNSHVFETASVQELREWVDALQRIAFGEATDCSQQRMSAPEHLLTDAVDCNELYGPVEHRTMFPVTIKENKTSSVLQLRGQHHLEISPTSVRLLSSDYTLRYQWLFQHIRKYGKAQDAFVLESGRSSETGAGTFIFRTHTAAQLQHQLMAAMSAVEARRRTAGGLDSSSSVAAAARPQTPPPPPPAQEPLQTQTLGRRATTRAGKVSKPPRRSKAAGTAATKAAPEDETTVSPLPNVIPLAEKQWIYNQSCDFTSPVVCSASAEPLYANEESDSARDSTSDELVYAEPEERQAAWRELGRNVVEHIEHSAQSSRRSSAIGVELAEDILRPVTSSAGARSSASYACLQHMAPRGGEPAQVGQYARLPTITSQNSTSGILVLPPLSVTSDCVGGVTGENTGAASDTTGAGSAGGENIYDDATAASFGKLASTGSEYENVSPGISLDIGEAKDDAVQHIRVNSMAYAVVQKPFLRN